MESTSTSTSPSNQVPTTSVFSTIYHPTLTSYTKNAVHKFIQARNSYLLAIKDANSTGNNIQAVSVKASIDRDLLLSLIEDGEFGLDISTYNSLTDDKINTFLHSITALPLENIPYETLEELVKSAVQIDMKENDATFRIKKLFMDYRTFLRTNKWESIIQDNIPLAIEHICLLLKPLTLQKKVKGDLKLSMYPHRENWSKFRQHVISQASVLQQAKAIYQEYGKSNNLQKDFKNAGSTTEIQPTPATYSKPSNRRQKPSSTKNHSQGHNRNSNRQETRSNPEPTNDSANNNISVNQQQASPTISHMTSDNSITKPNEPPLCLNRNKCPNERHFMKNCPTSTQEEKVTLIRQYRESNQNKPVAIKALRSLSELITPESSSSVTPDSGKFHGYLLDTIPVVVAGDYAADQCALSDSHLEQCRSAGLAISVTLLPSPIEINLALQNNESRTDLTFYTDRIAKISTTITTSTGPLRIHDIEYLVFKEEMNEVLWSRPLLQSMGFDLYSHLGNIRPHFHDADFETLSHDGAVSPNPDGVPQPTLLASMLIQRAPSLAHLEESAEHSVQDPAADWSAVGLNDDTETAKDLDQLVANAISSGFPSDHRDTLQHLLHEFKDIFRNRLGSDPPANVPPMMIQFKPGARPIRAKVRRYSPQQEEFLERKISELLKLGLVYRNPQSRWASPPLLIPKSGTEKFRMTVDLRAVNKQTEPTAWPMPHIDSITHQLGKSKLYFTIDFCHGFWQIPLHVDSQECQSIITPSQVVTPTRVLQGQTNSAFYFQSVIQDIFKNLSSSILQWIDDILGHCKTVSELLNLLRQIFVLCRQHKLKLHSKKCDLFKTQVLWCGRIINEKGVKLNPKNLSAILQIKSPSNGGQLQQFYCACNWLRQSIPDFARLTAPLQEFLQKVYNKVSSRTKKKVDKIVLKDLGWGATEQKAFEATKQAVYNSALLYHPDDAKITCLFTDASDLHWGAIVTQISKTSREAPFDQQDHQPLAFLSGSFKGASLHWSTPEKEAFPIIESVTRLDYILLRPNGFLLFTDHKNHTFIFSPCTANISIPKHVASKIQRWAFTLSSFIYEVVHIPGDQNHWADLLSRWGATNAETIQLKALFTAPIAPALQKQSTWPSQTDIKKSQTRHVRNEKPLHKDRNSAGLLINNDQSIWIPSNDTDLQMRLCIIGHCGTSGHRGIDTTYKTIKQFFFWKGMKKDINIFCKTCLHCISTIDGVRIPRPLSHSLHSTTPNELIHFDYLYMSHSQTGHVYVLIIKDDASSYV